MSLRIILGVYLIFWCVLCFFLSTGVDWIDILIRSAAVVQCIVLVTILQACRKTHALDSTSKKINKPLEKE